MRTCSENDRPISNEDAANTNNGEDGSGRSFVRRRLRRETYFDRKERKTFPTDGRPVSPCGQGERCGTESERRRLLRDTGFDNRWAFPKLNGPVKQEAKFSQS